MVKSRIYISARLHKQHRRLKISFIRFTMQCSVAQLISYINIMLASLVQLIDAILITSKYCIY
jgi:hypothetical protein